MIEIQGMMNVGSWLLRKVAPIIQSGEREIFLRKKSNNEQLSAALIAAVAAFRTRRLHIPGFLSSENSSVDSAVVDVDKKGAAIQVTSTWDDPNSPVYLDINNQVWERIQDKHKKGKIYCSRNHLCIFVGQQQYKNLYTERLNSKIKNDPHFVNYWLIAPYGDTKECRFIVCEIYAEGTDQQYECLVDFAPPGPIKINYLGNFLKSGELYCVVNLLKKEVCLMD